MELNLPQPPPLDVDERRFRQWVIECIRELTRAAAQNTEKMFDEFSNTGVVTESRILPAATGSLAEVRNVVGTLLRDVKRRGKKGVG